MGVFAAQKFSITHAPPGDHIVRSVHGGDAPLHAYIAVHSWKQMPVVPLVSLCPRAQCGRAPRRCWRPSRCSTRSIRRHRTRQTTRSRSLTPFWATGSKQYREGPANGRMTAQTGLKSIAVSAPCAPADVPALITPTGDCAAAAAHLLPQMIDRMASRWGFLPLKSSASPTHHPVTTL